MTRLEKLTSAVRETGVSWHTGGVIKGLVKPLNTIVLWRTGGFRCSQLDLHDAERRKSLTAMPLVIFFSSLLE